MAKKFLDFFFNHKTAILFIVIFCVYFAYAELVLDPDFGWHVRAGEEIVGHGFLRGERMIYSVPDYTYANHSWFQSVIFYLLSGSKILLAFYSAGLALAAFVFVYCTPKRETRRFIFLPFILAAATNLQFFGARAQIATWAFSAFIFYLLWERARMKRCARFLPLVFLLWANMHAGFVVGLLMISLYWVYHTIIGSRPFSFFVITLSFGVTFINPYGADLYREIFSILLDTRLHTLIAEWNLGILLLDGVILFFAALGAVLVVRFRQKLTLYEILILIFWYTQAALSRRNIPLWGFYLTPFVAFGLERLYREVVKNKVSRGRFAKVSAVTLAIVLAGVGFELLGSFQDARRLGEQTFYPKAAMDFLQSHPGEGNIFNEYGWGGYIEWKYGKKVFIDGRAASWYSTESSGNLGDVFGTYVAITSGERDYREIFERFGVDQAVLRKGQNGGVFDGLGSYLTHVFSNKEEEFSLAAKLESDGWSVAFEDGYSIVLAAPAVSK